MVKVGTGPLGTQRELVGWRLWNGSDGKTERKTN